MNSAAVAPDASSKASSSDDADKIEHHICSRFLKKKSPDIYGQRHAIETSKCVNDSLRLLEKEIRKLPDDLRSGLDQATLFCPELLTKEHMLMFLRCEQFNVDLAAIRLAKYWNRRIELFQGEAFKPLSISNEDTKEMSIGFLRLLPDTDGTGRCNIYIDPRVLEGKEYANERMVRASWLLLHQALETESSQQKGIVFLVYLEGALLRHFDRALVKLIANSIRGILPVRVSGIHMFYPPYLFEVLFDVISILLGDRLTKRIKLHSDDEKSVLHDKLMDFGIFPSRLPSELGGELRYSDGKWKKSVLKGCIKDIE